jgi:hypothetical protein
LQQNTSFDDILPEEHQPYFSVLIDVRRAIFTIMETLGEYFYSLRALTRQHQNLQEQKTILKTSFTPLNGQCIKVSILKSN